jgi:Rrf2 family protein
MRITALEEYGLRCMVLLARQKGDNPLTLPEFAAREGFSIPYAGKLLMILKNSGLVKAVRGRKGGYVLASDSKAITLKEIFRVLDKPVFSVGYCEKYTGEDGVCVHSGDCAVKNIWQTFDEFIESFLERVTLADLASGDINPLEENGLKLRQKA